MFGGSGVHTNTDEQVIIELSKYMYTVLDTMCRTEYEIAE